MSGLTTGRVEVVPGANSVTLVLAQWTASRQATLAPEEALALARKLEEAVSKLDAKAP